MTMPEDVLLNTGVLQRPPSAKDWVLGGITGLDRVVRRPDGNWLPFKSEPHEMQLRYGRDFMTCTKFAALDAVEAFMFGVYGIRVNYSERALAIFCNQPKDGDNLANVAETIRTMGLVPEEECPWTEDLDTFEKYMTLPPGELERLKAIGQAWLEKWKFGWDFVYDNWGDLSIYDALKLSPIFAAGLYAYESSKDADGAYHSSLPDSDRTTHAFTLMNAEGGYKFIDDSYVAQIKKLAPDFRIPVGVRIDIVENVTKPPMSTYVFKEGYKYFVAESKGFTLFCFAGKLRLDDLAKCTDQWLSRNKGKGNILDLQDTVTPRELAGHKVYDLKGNEVDVSHLLTP